MKNEQAQRNCRRLKPNKDKPYRNWTHKPTTEQTIQVRKLNTCVLHRLFFPCFHFDCYLISSFHCFVTTLAKRQPSFQCSAYLSCHPKATAVYWETGKDHRAIMASDSLQGYWGCEGLLSEPNVYIWIQTLILHATCLLIALWMFSIHIWCNFSG